MTAQTPPYGVKPDLFTDLEANLGLIKAPGNKRIGYNYPKSVVRNGYLYVAYSTHKETVDITRVLLDGLRK